MPACRVVSLFFYVFFRNGFQHVKREKIFCRISRQFLSADGKKMCEGTFYGAVEIRWKSPYGLVIPNPHPQLRRISSPSQQILGRYPAKFGFGRMSPRGRNKFLFAGFGRIPVTRLLSVRSKAEKKTGIFLHKTAPLCSVLWGIFTF